MSGKDIHYYSYDIDKIMNDLINQPHKTNITTNRNQIIDVISKINYQSLCGKNLKDTFHG